MVWKLRERNRTLRCDGADFFSRRATIDEAHVIRLAVFRTRGEAAIADFAVCSSDFFAGNPENSPSPDSGLAMRWNCVQGFPMRSCFSLLFVLLILFAVVAGSAMIYFLNSDATFERVAEARAGAPR